MGERRIAALVAVAVVAAVSWAAPAAAAEPAAIRGTVVHGTTSEPAAGVEVTLTAVVAGLEAGSWTATTAGDGTFAFTDLKVSDEREYVVAATYEGLAFTADPVPLAAGESREVAVTVYGTTTSSAEVRIASWIVWVDREGAGSALQHDFDIVNAGDASFVGRTSLPDGGTAVITLPIPAGAGGFQYLGMFMGCCPYSRDGAFAHTAPIHPGESRGTVRLTAPQLRSLSLVAPLPTDTLTVLVPREVAISSARLQAGATVESRGLTYQAYTATGLAAGDAVEVELSGFGGSGTPWLATALIALGIAAIALLVALRLLRRRGAGRRVTASGPAPGVRRKAGRPTPPATAKAMDAASPPPAVAAGEPVGENEAELLIDELAVLDVAFGRGLVEEEMYHRIRNVRKARLLDLHERTREAVASETGR